VRSGRRDQDQTKDRTLKTHFIVLGALEPEVFKVRRLPNSAVCECRWSRTWLQKARSNASAASASAKRSVITDRSPGALRLVTPTSPVGAQPRGSSLSAVAAGVTTRRVTGAVSSGKKRRRPLQTERQKVSEGAQPQSTPLLLKPSGPDPLPSRRIWARAGITSSVWEGVLSRPPPVHHQILNPLLSRSRRRPRSLM
jgi:hypothetical protein